MYVYNTVEVRSPNERGGGGRRRRQDEADADENNNNNEEDGGGEARARESHGEKGSSNHDQSAPGGATHSLTTLQPANLPPIYSYGGQHHVHHHHQFMSNPSLTDERSSNHNSSSSTMAESGGLSRSYGTRPGLLESMIGSISPPNWCMMMSASLFGLVPWGSANFSLSWLLSLISNQRDLSWGESQEVLIKNFACIEWWRRTVGGFVIELERN